MTPKQREAWKRNWGLMILAAFQGQLRNYENQTGVKFSRLRAEVKKVETELRVRGVVRRKKNERDSYK